MEDAPIDGEGAGGDVVDAGDVVAAAHVAKFGAKAAWIEKGAG
jgi:hypothetical protein